MNTIKKILTVIFTLLALVPIPVLAEQDSLPNIVHDAALSDHVQEGFGRFGGGLSHNVKEFIIDNDKLNKITAASGKLIKNAATAAPHVGWASSAAGRFVEYDFSGGTIVVLNGLSRTTTVAAVGTTAGTAASIWLGGKIGASLGGLGGPVGAGFGFVVGCGSAYISGKIWDKTVGTGAKAFEKHLEDLEYGSAQNNKDIVQLVTQLNHTKLLDMIKTLKTTSPNPYLDCLCRNANYGSSTARQFYHPGTIGTFDERYSCQHPGDPCVVAGFGCLRHPLPKEKNIRDKCMKDNRFSMTKDKNGKNDPKSGIRLDELIMNELHIRAMKSERKYQDEVNTDELRQAPFTRIQK